MPIITNARVANVQKKSWFRNATKNPRMAGTRAPTNPATSPAPKQVMPAAIESGDMGRNRNAIHATTAITAATAATTTVGSSRAAERTGEGMAGSLTASRVITVVTARIRAIAAKPTTMPVLVSPNTAVAAVTAAKPATAPSPFIIPSDPEARPRSAGGTTSGMTAAYAPPARLKG